MAKSGLPSVSKLPAAIAWHEIVEAIRPVMVTCAAADMPSVPPFITLKPPGLTPAPPQEVATSNLPSASRSSITYEVTFVPGSTGDDDVGAKKLVAGPLKKSASPPELLVEITTYSNPLVALADVGNDGYLDAVPLGQVTPTQAFSTHAPAGQTWLAELSAEGQSCG